MEQLEYDLINIFKLHLWIILVFFLHGTLLTYVAGRYAKGLLRLDSLGVLIATGFALSILINFVILALLSLLGKPLSSALWYLLVLDLCLLVVVLVRYRRNPLEIEKTNLSLWIVVIIFFVTMSQNGGLVDRLADSWWHMSYANKMMLSETVFLNTHHFLGVNLSSLTMAYEPGWHANLALLSIVSGFSLPFIWHSLGAWCLCVAIISYYLLTLAVTENKKLSILSAILFVLVFGAINSYARVAPWPGNVSFSVFYLALTTVFVILTNAGDNLARSAGSVTVRHKIHCLFHNQTVLITLLLTLLLLISVVHLAELVWFTSSLAFYSYMFWILGRGTRSLTDSKKLEVDIGYLKYLWIIYLLALGGFALDRNPDPVFVSGVTVVIAALALISSAPWRSEDGGFIRKSGTAALLAVIVILVAVNYRHLMDLFYPDPVWSAAPDKYVPKYVAGYFDEKLRLPHWNHQLRSGLLFGGLAGVVASIFLISRRISRGTVFFCGNTIISFLIILSPYLFTYFGSVLPIDRVYRFNVLIFHPVVLAMLLSFSMEKSISGLKVGTESRDKT